MRLKERLNDDLKSAMRAGSDVQKRTIRMALAAIRNAEIAAGHLFDDAEVSDVLRRQVKQRRDSIEEFAKAKRDDLVQRETEEATALQAYLPQSLSHEEIAIEARAVIAQVQATGPRDKGKVMGPLLARLGGRAEGRDVNDVVTGLLAAK